MFLSRQSYFTSAMFLVGGRKGVTVGHSWPLASVAHRAGRNATSVNLPKP